MSKDFHIWPLVSSWPGSPLLGWLSVGGIHAAAAAGDRLSFKRCHEGLDETRDPKANDITASKRWSQKKKHAISLHHYNLSVLEVIGYGSWLPINSP